LVLYNGRRGAVIEVFRGIVKGGNSWQREKAEEKAEGLEEEQARRGVTFAYG